MKAITIKPVIFFLLFSALIYATTAQNIYTFAGTGTVGFNGDGGPAINAELNAPAKVAVDALGNVYIADQNNSRVRKVATSGIISTFAGTGNFTFGGDGALATAADLFAPNGMAIDLAGNVFIVDAGNNRIRKVNVSGIISTIAGNGSSGYGGDGGAATNATLSSTLRGVAVDAIGNIYIADDGNRRVRKVDPSGIITTFAGTGVSGWGGDGGLAINAQLENVFGVTVDASGNVYVSTGPRIRKVNTSGIITTYAGTGVYGSSGDGGLATSAQILAVDLAADAFGNVYFSDNVNNRIRKINTSGTITTVAGNGIGGFSGDGGPATSAQIYAPSGVAADANGRLFIADPNNNRIRVVCTSTSGCLTNINTVETDEDFISIYPNPNKGFFSITTNIELKIGKLVLMNSLGQPVYEQGMFLGENFIQIKSIPSGLYNCVLLDEGKIIRSHKISID